MTRLFVNKVPFDLSRVDIIKERGNAYYLAPILQSAIIVHLGISCPVTLHFRAPSGLYDLLAGRFEVGQVPSKLVASGSAYQFIVVKHVDAQGRLRFKHLNCNGMGRLKFETLLKRGEHAWSSACTFVLSSYESKEPCVSHDKLMKYSGDRFIVARQDRADHEPLLVTFQFNHFLNSEEYIDHHGSLPLLILWIKATSRLAKKGLIKNATFPFCQSSGMGKTKMIGQLCLIPDLSCRFWTVHIVCRKAQGMLRSPFVRHLLDRLDFYQQNRDTLASVKGESGGAEEEDENDPDEAILSTLAIDVIRVVSQMLYVIIKHQNNQPLELETNSPFDNDDDELSFSAKEDVDDLSGSERDQPAPPLPHGPFFQEESFYRMFRYAESLGERRLEMDFFRRILRCPSTDMLGPLFAQLVNKKLVVVWDEARGLFQGEIIEEKYALLLRAVKRASRIAASQIKDVEDASVCFILMDTSARVSNFLKPAHMDPSELRLTEPGESSALPSMTVFSQACHHDAFIRPLIIELLRMPVAINQARLEDSVRVEEEDFSQRLKRGESAYLFGNSLFFKLFCGVGRPLHWELAKKAQDLESLIGIAMRRMDPVDLGHDFFLPIIATRVPTNIPGRCIEAYDSVAKSTSTMVLLSPDNGSLSAEQRPELLVASASARLMSKYKEKVFDQLTGYLSNYGPEAGLGGELLAMMMGLAAVDHITSFRPHFSVKLAEWISVFTGCPAMSARLPSWCSGALLCLCQFIYMDLEIPDWLSVEQARLYGVGIVPRDRRNKGYDLLVPFELEDGNAGAILLSVKNSIHYPSSDDKKKLEEQASALRKARSDYFIARGISGNRDHGVLSLLVCLAHGVGTDAALAQFHGPMKANKRRKIAYPELEPIKVPGVKSCPSGVFAEKRHISARVYFDAGLNAHLPMQIIDENTWGMPERLISCLRLLADDKSYVLRGWRVHGQRFDFGSVDFEHYVEASLIERKAIRKEVLGVERNDESGLSFGYDDGIDVDDGDDGVDDGDVGVESVHDDSVETLDVGEVEGRILSNIPADDDEVGAQFNRAGPF